MNQKLCDLCKYAFVGQEVTYFVSTGTNSSGMFGGKKQRAEICLECYKKVINAIGGLKK